MIMEMMSLVFIPAKNKVFTAGMDMCNIVLLLLLEFEEVSQTRMIFNKLHLSFF